MLRAAALPVAVALATAVAAAWGCGPADFTHPASEWQVGVGEVLEIPLVGAGLRTYHFTIAEGEVRNMAIDRVNGQTATLRFAPQADQAGPHRVVVRATAAGFSDDVELRIDVLPEGGGAPVFVSAESVILDLERSATLEAVVEVKDDDSASVAMALEAGPSSAELRGIDASGKRMELTWTPTAGDVQAACLYEVRVRAEDPEGHVASQSILVQILGGGCGSDCPGAPPAIAVAVLGDQDEPGPYALEATVSDGESAVGEVTVRFVGLPPESVGPDTVFGQAALEPAGGDLYRGEIPAFPEDTTVSYSVCASDDDDTTGGACDHRACAPAGDDLYSFRVLPGAGPAGNGTCASPFDLGGLSAGGSNGAAAAANSGSCGGDGPEVVFRLDLATTATVTLSTDWWGTVADTVLYARTECGDPASELGCNDDVSWEILASSLTLYGAPAGPLYVFVDSYSASSAGAYELTAEVGP